MVGLLSLESCTPVKKVEVLFLVGLELYGLRGEVDIDYCNVRRVCELVLR